MKQILTYIKLHFRLQFGRDSRADRKSGAISLILSVITCAVVFLLAKYVFDVVSVSFMSKITPRQFSAFIFTIVELVLIVFGISFEIKMFLNDKDTKITARLPISSFQLFVAQLVIVYVYLLALSYFCLFPLIMLFGSSVGIISVSFVFELLLAIFFAPMIPFAIATLLVVPITYILIALKNQNVIKLILFLLMLAGLFVLYSYVLNFLADYYVNQKIDMTTQEGVVKFIVALSNEWNLFVWVNNIAFGHEMLKSIAIVLGGVVVVLTCGLLIAKPIYSKIRESILEGGKGIFAKKTKITSDNAFFAIFKKEFKEILRTHTYSYFYLGVAITTPVMVILTNKLVAKVGTAQLGGNINFGVSILVVLAFMSMINAFSAISINREGRQFYITKIVPVRYKTQLLSKACLNIVVSALALVISVSVLRFMKFITVLQAVMILLASILLALGIIFHGLNVNVRHVSTNVGDSDNQSNITLVMFLGLLLSAVEGCCAIVFGFFMKPTLIYLILVGVAFAYALVNILIFALTVNKKYYAIE